MKLAVGWVVLIGVAAFAAGAAKPVRDAVVKPTLGKLAPSVWG